jgi:nucleoid-associated protein YgaU
MQGTVGARPTIVLATAPPVVPASSPTVPSAIAPTSVTAVKPHNREYVVQPGDTLRSIAELQYGDAGQWPRIYQANQDVIGPDPDALRAGMQLRLPD